jgi:transposase
MPKALNPEQKATVTAMLAAKAPQRDIAQAASCSVSQVKRMAKNIRRWGAPVAPKLLPQGRPRALTPDVAKVLRISPLDPKNIALRLECMSVLIRGLGVSRVFSTASVRESWGDCCLCV